MAQILNCQWAAQLVTLATTKICSEVGHHHPQWKICQQREKIRKLKISCSTLKHIPCHILAAADQQPPLLSSRKRKRISSWQPQINHITHFSYRPRRWYIRKSRQKPSPETADQLLKTLHAVTAIQPGFMSQQPKTNPLICSLLLISAVWFKTQYKQTSCRCFSITSLRNRNAYQKPHDSNVATTNPSKHFVWPPFCTVSVKN